MFVLGTVLGVAVLMTEAVRRPDARRRSMTDAQALGYRAALGEHPVTMPTRRD